jgi:hypothetical protein
MDKEKFQERVDRIKEVDTIIKTLDPAIREAAFKVLESYITGKSRKPVVDPDASSTGTGTGTVISESEEAKSDFFSKLDHEKPSDNALSVAAYHYSQYGTAVLTTKEVREIADSVGITVPSRIDATFGAATRKQKSLFQNLGRGKFKLTVHGEKFFKEKYGVSKGTRTKESEETE